VSPGFLLCGKGDWRWFSTASGAKRVDLAASLAEAVRKDDDFGPTIRSAKGTGSGKDFQVIQTQGYDAALMEVRLELRINHEPDYTAYRVRREDL
jgi:hypothetical protein